MDYRDIQKLIKYTKDFVEFQKILKHVLLDYVSIKEENKKLVSTNLALLEDLQQYRFIVSEEKEEIVIH